MKILKVALTLVCVSLFAVSAFASSCGSDPSDPACAPSMTLTWTIQGSGQQHTAASSQPVWTGSNWLLNFTPQTGVGYVFTGGQLASSPDPFLSYSFGVVNKSSKSMIFNFDYTTTYTGSEPIYAAETFFSDRLSFLGRTGSASVAPYADSNFPYAYLQNSLLNGALIPNFQLGKGCTASVGNPCSSAGPYDVFELLSAPSSGTLEIKGQFILGANSSYTIQGETDLFAVPEPGTLLMLGSGVLGLSTLLRRRLQS